MKRIDLTPGMDVYHDTSRDWQKWASGGRKVRVVDTRAWASGRSYALGTTVHSLLDGSEITTHIGTALVPSGSGVLVNRTPDDDDDDGPSYDVVSLTSLRGPWAQTKAAVDQTAAAEREARSLATEQRLVDQERFNARGADLMARINALGVGPAERHLSYSHYSMHELPGVTWDLLTALVQAAERAQR